MISFKFDVICFSESKIVKGIEPKVSIDIEGYQSPIGMPTESTKGGVLIYVKDGLNFKPRPDLNMHKSKELESFFVEIINKNESNDIVGVINRHPCMVESTFNDDYLKIMTDKLSEQNKKIFIAGDFNFNLLNSASHAETFEFFDNMMSNFLLPVINLPTKINRGNNSLIDNIFTNQLHPDAKSGNFSINLSDGHVPSFLILPRRNQNHLPKNHNIYTRDTKNFNLKNFEREFSTIDWNEVIEVEKNDVNYSMEQFLSVFNKILDNHMPLKKVTNKQFKQRYKPWISDDILKKISEKAALFQKYIKSKNGATKNESYGKYKAKKNEVTFLTRTSKKAYYERYFIEHKNNLQKVWKGIKQIINVKSKTLDSPN